MRTGLCALLWLMMAVSPSFATRRLAECSGWDGASLGDCAHAADVTFNHDRQGRPILSGLTQAVWLIKLYGLED